MNILQNYRTFGNEQIEIRFIAGEECFAQKAFATLSDALPAITNYFRISGSFPKVRVVIVIHRSEFDRLVRDFLQVEIELPSHPARIAQPQRTDMVVLSPSAYEAHSIFKYNPDEFRRLLIHELVHMVEEFLSPDIETIPRWWSEGLAVYLSGQWIYEDEFRKAAIDGVSQKDVPGFRQIEEERQLAYDWGWTIVRFVESEYGSDMVLRIVKECADGQVFTVMGGETENLERQWRDWLTIKESLIPDL